MAQKTTRLESLKSGDGSGTFDAMEHRVAFLEKSFEKMDGKLDVIIKEMSYFRTDLTNLRVDVTKDISGLRSDVSSDISSLRADVTKNISSLREGVAKDISSLRVEVSSDIAAFRQEVAKDNLHLRESVAYLKGRVETLPTIESFAELGRSVGELAGYVKTLPSGESFGELRGRMASLPTTAKLASLLGIAVGVIAITNKWPGLIDAIFVW